jgi:RES domain-containing protein
VEKFEPDPVLLKRLSRLEPHAWAGSVWRHTFADNPPDKTNVRGARWNPPDVEVLYTSLDRSTAIAEADHLIEIQPVPLRAKRTIYRLEIGLKALVDLSDRALLASLGVDDEALSGDDHSHCRAVGGAAAFLHFDGIIVPSARSPGHNIVILFGGADPVPEVRVVESETLDRASAFTREVPRPGRARICGHEQLGSA